MKATVFIASTILMLTCATATHGQEAGPSRAEPPAEVQRWNPGRPADGVDAMIYGMFHQTLENDGRTPAHYLSPRLQQLMAADEARTERRVAADWLTGAGTDWRFHDVSVDDPVASIAHDGLSGVAQAWVWLDHREDSERRLYFRAERGYWVLIDACLYPDASSLVERLETPGPAEPPATTTGEEPRTCPAEPG